MKFSLVAVLLLSCQSTASAFMGATLPKSASTSSNTATLFMKDNNSEYDGKITSIFPKSLPNSQLVSKVTSMLGAKGYTTTNTLVATSLCCDELARNLEQDFVKIYGNNFNLGGLAGFPFAGMTGFGAMSAHIPDDGSCLIIYGPHVGVATTGVVGKVERKSIELVDNCCGSAIAASNYVAGIVEGGAGVTVKSPGDWTDFQQGAVQELLLPHGKRLADAKNKMIELPYALYDSQEILMEEIIKKGCGGIKNKIALLGGIQINTAPDTADYFLPFKFQYLNNKGEIEEDMLAELMGEPAKKISSPPKVEPPKTELPAKKL